MAVFGVVARAANASRIFIASGDLIVPASHWDAARCGAGCAQNDELIKVPIRAVVLP